MPSSHSSWLRSDRVGFDLQAIHSASDSNNLIKALIVQIDASKEACIKSAQTSLRYFDISTKEKKNLNPSKLTKKLKSLSNVVSKLYDFCFCVEH